MTAAYECLTTLIHGHVFDDDALLAGFAFQLCHRLELLDEEAHEPNRPVDMNVGTLNRLSRHARTGQEHGHCVVDVDHLHREEDLRRVGGPELAEEGNPFSKAPTSLRECCRVIS